MAADYDVFVSHAWADGGRPQEIAAALAASGLRVWFDANEINDFASITLAVTNGLARSKALLAYYSKTYPLRRACQWELTAAFLAAQNEGDPRRRVLVVNPEKSADHIHPIELRDAKFRNSASDGGLGLDELVESVAKHIADLDRPLESIARLSSPDWYGTTPVGSTRFLGRMQEMWEVHSLLHAGDVTPITGAPLASGSIGIVRGLGGIGKSLLAEEYALHFGAAYPGGIFWLRAYGNDDSGAAQNPEEREAERAGQIRTIAERLGVSTRDLSETRIAGELAREIESNNKPCLWIVDDLPNGLDNNAFRRWLSPHPLARTLITTRSREYGSLAKGIDLSVLEPEQAYHLLTSRRKVAGSAEEEQAHQLAEDLGRHALALDITASALVSYGDIEPYRKFREELSSGQEDALELATELADALPNGHETSICQTMLRSFRSLGPEGQDFLRLASVLAVAPIPASVVTAVFRLADGVDGELAQRRQRRAFHVSTAASVAEIKEGRLDAREVHTLVSRAVRFGEEASRLRREVLRSTAIEALRADISKDLKDARLIEETELLVVHARHLASIPTDLGEAALARSVALHDHMRGAYASMRLILSRELEFRKRSQGLKDDDTLGSVCNLANCLLAQGDLKGAQKILEETLSYLGEHLSKHSIILLQTLGIVLEKRGLLAQAKKVHQELLAGSVSVMGLDHEITLASMNNLAEVLAAEGDLRGARSLQEGALAGRARVLGPEHPNTLQSMNNLASTLLAQGDFKGAKKLQEKCLALRRQLLGPEHPDTLQSMNNQASILKEQGDRNGSLKLQKEALEVIRRTLGPEHPQTLTVMSNLAANLQESGRSSEARQLLEDALSIQQRELGPEHQSTLVSMSNLSNALYTSGDFDGAKRLLNEVVTVARRTLGVKHAITLQAMYNLTVILWSHGSISEARALNEEALNAHVATFGIEHARTSLCAWNLFGNCHEKGETKAASSVFRRYLMWLMERDPSTLASDQQEIQAILKRSVKWALPPKSRNAPCPCGSGLKYKRCCGA